MTNSTALSRRKKDTTGSLRGAAFLERLAASKGAPVRVDTSGADLSLLDALVVDGYASSRAEAYRKALREAAARQSRAKRTKKRSNPDE